MAQVLIETKEESEKYIQERLDEIKEQYEAQIDHDRELIRAECMEELRGEKEQ